MGIKHDQVMIKCALDEDECIDLLTVLRVVNQINQEQAWAICYEICGLMQRLSPTNCAIIDSLDQIQMHKDGYVHQKSLLLPSTQLSPFATSVTTLNINNNNLNINNNNSPDQAATTTTTTTIIQINSPTTTTTTQQTTTINNNNNNEPHHDHQNHQQLQQQQQQQHKQLTTSPPTPPITPELGELLRRRPAMNEFELVESLGIALFWALDYGIPDDEERKLSQAMEYFIIQAHKRKLSLQEVLKICIDRLPIATKSHADSYYSSVCKTLLSDTIELSIFLEKIYTASMVLSDITLDNCLESNHKCDMSDEDLSEPLASLRALRALNDWARLWMQVIRELRQRGKFKQALLVN